MRTRATSSCFGTRRAFASFDPAYSDALFLAARPVDGERAQWLRLFGDMLGKLPMYGYSEDRLGDTVDRARRALDCYFEALALESGVVDVATIGAMLFCASTAGERDVVQRLRSADEVAKAATRAAREGRPVDAEDLEARARALVLEARANRRRV